VHLDRGAPGEAICERLHQDPATVARVVRAGDQLGDRGAGVRRSLRRVTGQEPEDHAR